MRVISQDGRTDVAPFAGAWIEIYHAGFILRNGDMSLPSRERGLKWRYAIIPWQDSFVAPFAGAWIEIELKII